MTDPSEAADRQSSSTALALPLAAAATPAPAARVQHSMPYVAQLIAHARLAVLPRRRKSDRAEPLRAYAAVSAPRAATQRIV